MVSKAIENAQVKVETHNFDIRKHIVEYDDVANKQREIIYGARREILKGVSDREKARELREDLLSKIKKEIENLILMHFPEGGLKADYEKIIKEFVMIVPFDETSQKKLFDDASKIKNSQKLTEFLNNLAKKVYEEREKSLGEKVARDIEKFTSLSVVDTLWIQHLDTLEDLREGIGLRAAGQRDPLVEYKGEAFSLFEKLMASIDYEIVHRIYKVQVRQEPKIEEIEEKGVEVHPEAKLESGNSPQPTLDASQEPDGPRPPATDAAGYVGPATAQSPVEKDPTEMSDEELEAEIQKLEALERSSQSTVESQQSGVVNPFESLNRKPLTVNKIGRNDPCPCGAIDPNTKKPYKWKKCGLINSLSHKA